MLIDMRTQASAGQMFFKAIEAIRAGHVNIGMQVLHALSCCSFPNIRSRADDALTRFGAVAPVSSTTGPEAA